MSVRKHRDPRVRKREERKVRRRALHKHRSGAHADTRRKEAQVWADTQISLSATHDE